MFKNFFFCLIIYLSIISLIISVPKELSNYYETELQKGTSEYYYIYNISNGNTLFHKETYIFIKFSNYQKINLRVFIDEAEAFYSLPKEKDEWICIDTNGAMALYPFEKRVQKVKLQINTKEKNIKMIFIDSSNTLRMNLKQFLNLNFITGKLVGEPFPLVFEINVDKNVSFAFKEDIYYSTLDKYIIYNIEKNNFYKYEGINKTSLMEENNIFRYTLSSYLYKGHYHFHKIKILYYMEEIYIKNNTFEINNFTENNYLVLNTHNFRNISFYINDNSGFFHQYYSIALLSQNNFTNFYNNINSTQFKQITNGKINYMTNEINYDYLIININNKSKKNKGFILFFNEILEINKIDGSNNIDKGTHALIYIYMNYLSSAILLSSSKNMKFFNSKDEFTNKIDIKNKEESILYIDSSEINTKFFHNFFNEDNIDKFYNTKFLLDNDINKILNINDNCYIRKIWTKNKLEFFSFYFFDINDKYYIHTKKYFGNANLFKYKKYLDIFTSVNNFMKPISYYDKTVYDIVNNQLLILNGTQFFSFYMGFGTFFNFFIQKVNDNNYIEINNDINKYCNNTVKLLKSMKKYFIKSELNHLIKLDNDFLDAEVIFIDNTGRKYILNRENKLINLKGNNFNVESNKNALIYFYEKIQDFDNKIIIEFNKNNKGKKLKINIKNKNINYDLKIAIAKDFGFKDYYPMINSQDLEILTIAPKETITLYIENYYDLLELNISELEGEKYYIYFFEINKYNKLTLLNKNNIEVSQPIYFDSLTKNYQLGYDIIPKGNSNLILNLPDKISNINYQFIKCSNNDIYFELNKEKEIINTNTYIQKKIDNKFQALIHSFESSDEFLFVYDFRNADPYGFYRIKNYAIKYINKNNKNILIIGFTPVYSSITEYNIIIAKKNAINNLYSFSNPCYLAKLIMNNSKEICYKKVYHSNNPYQYIIFEEIDINKLIQNNNENDEYIISIMANNLETFNHLDVYTPVIYNEKNKIKGAKKLKFFEKIFFEPEKDYFIYEHLSNEKLVFQIENFDQGINNENTMIVTKNNDIIDKNFYEECKILEIVFEKKGVYFIEFFSDEYDSKNDHYFFLSYALNILIEEIDLRKINYSGYLTNSAFSFPLSNNLPYYKVINLKEDKTVYFTYNTILIDNLCSPFIICENKNDRCVDNVIIYNFYKGKEYTIYINKLKNRKVKINYSFFPIFNNTIEYISQEGYYTINTPKIFFIKKNKEFYFDIFNIKVYFVSDEGFIQSKYMPKINYRYINNIKICSFFIEKNFEFRNIILIPEDNNKLKQIFITKERLSLDSDQIEVKAGTNSLIDLSYYYNNKYRENNFKNNYITFTSPVENIRFISLDTNYKNKKFIYSHLFEKYLYIDKHDTDIYINRNIYAKNYIYFSILNDDTINNFIESKRIYFNKRLNTDSFPCNDLINLYIDKFNTKYNLYVKKYYGSIQLYESQYILNNFTADIELTLSKPINNLKEKKSIFNRLIQLNKNQIITGYLSGNSLLDIYIEKDNDNSDIYLNDFKNRKYLKKGIEYKFHFNLNHLIKLEQPQLNTEIIIYNNDTKIILNQRNQIGIVLGNNFKINSNENGMIYFYPKTKKFQKKIESKIGETVQIKRNSNIIYRYSIDFGFEGYEPPDMELNYYKGEFYLENIYNKLETNLTQGEYLYIYYDATREDIFEINYLKNEIILSDYKYNFIPIKKNSLSDNKYIIPNVNKNKMRLQINLCKNNPSISKYKLRYKTDEYSGEILNSSNILLFYGYPFYKYSFEFENDFILTYTEIKSDSTKKNRLKYDNLTINNISIINDKKININFNTNYKNSFAKYIIMVTQEEKNNTFENMNNFCFLTELINKKEENFITEEIYDIGENDFISIDVDISKLSCVNKNCTVNIISQELTYEQILSFYEPKFFCIEKNIFDNIKKYIVLILGFALLFSLIYLYYKHSSQKINHKKFGNNKIKFTHETNLGTELSDSNDLLCNNITN